MLKFATSVSWRVLRVFAATGGLSGFPDHILTKVDNALQEWARFLLGHQPDPGPHEQHMFLADVVAGSSIANVPPNISRYLARTIEVYVAHTQDSAISYAKMGKFVLFGFVAMKYPLHWKGTRLNVQQGRFGQNDVEFPSEVRDFVFDALDWRQRNILRFQNANKRRFGDLMNGTLTVQLEARLSEPCITTY